MMMYPNSWRLTVAAEALPRSRTSAIRMDSMSAWRNSSCSYMQQATVRGKKLTHNFRCLLWLHKNPARGLSLGAPPRAPDDGGDLRWWKYSTIHLHSPALRVADVHCHSGRLFIRISSDIKCRQMEGRFWMTVSYCAYYIDLWQ